MNLALQSAVESVVDFYATNWGMEGAAARKEAYGDVENIIVTALAELETHGWRLVPVESWLVQQKAARKAGIDKYPAIYRAMVAAAPRVTEETI